MQYVIAAAMSILNVPYLYGGKHPSQGGVDCSGAVSYILSTAGMTDLLGLNAQGIYNAIIQKPGTQIQVKKPGAVAFFGADLKNITHVAFLIDQNRMIESGGGDHNFTVVEPLQQAAHYAGVRIRLISHRKDLVAILYPSYASIGLF